MFSSRSFTFYSSSSSSSPPDTGCHSNRFSQVGKFIYFPPETYRDDQAELNLTIIIIISLYEKPNQIQSLSVDIWDTLLKTIIRSV